MEEYLQFWMHMFTNQLGQSKVKYFTVQVKYFTVQQAAVKKKPSVAAFFKKKVETHPAAVNPSCQTE